jgi:hypothetical protein
MQMRHVLAQVALLAVVAAGCSGDDDVAATTSTSSEATTASTSRTAPSRTVPDTTAPTSTTLPTTEAATTTTLPVEQQVRQAMLGYYDFYWRCLRAPSECDPLEVAVPDSDAFRALTTGRDGLIKGNYFVGPEDVGYMVITAIEPAGDHTLVTTCWYSTAWLYFQPPSPGAPPTVQNNTPGSSIETYQFIQMPDLSWKVRRGDTVESYTEENRCPPQS